MRGRRGLSLFELLVVLALFGILFSISFSSYQTSRKRNRVLAARAQIEGVFKNTRSAVWRYNADGEIRAVSDRTLVAKVERGGKTYFTARYTLPPDVKAEFSRNGSTWSAISKMSRIPYLAPYAETQATPLVIRVQHQARPEIAACFRVIGVTGKVVTARACP